MSALEPLLLRDAESLAARVADADRAAIAEALALSRQKVRAGDALWSAGQVAEGLLLAREALLEALAPVPRLAPGGPDELRAWLARRGLGEAAIARVIAARRRAEDEALPARDAEVARAHARLYDELQLARRDLDRALDPAGRTPASIRRARVARIAGALAVAIVAIVAAAIALRDRPGLRVEASGQFGTGHQFAPANAVDGHAETEWLLPDATSGFLELHVSPARRVDRVRITNSHNAPHGDRAAREVRIELRGGGRTLRVLDHTFDAIESDPQPHAIEVGAGGGVEGVDRVRVTVLSWHRAGGGLAEVALE